MNEFPGGTPPSQPDDSNIPNQQDDLDEDTFVRNKNLARRPQWQSPTPTTNESSVSTPQSTPDVHNSWELSNDQLSTLEHPDETTPATPMRKGILSGIFQRKERKPKNTPVDSTNTTTEQPIAQSIPLSAENPELASETSGQRIKSLEDELALKDQNLQELFRQVSDYEQVVETLRILQERLGAAAEHNQALKEQLHNAESQRNMLYEQYRDAFDYAQQLDSALDRTQRAHGLASHQLNEQTIRANHLEGKVRETQTDLTQAGHKLGRLSTHNDALQTENQGLSQRANKAEGEVTRLTPFEEMYHRASNTLNAETIRANAAQSDLDKERFQHEATRGTLAQTQAVVEPLREENKTLDVANRALIRETTRQKAEIERRKGLRNWRGKIRTYKNELPVAGTHGFHSDWEESMEKARLERDYPIDYSTVSPDDIKEALLSDEVVVRSRMKDKYPDAAASKGSDIDTSPLPPFPPLSPSSHSTDPLPMWSFDFDDDDLFPATPSSATPLPSYFSPLPPLAPSMPSSSPSLFPPLGSAPLPPDVNNPPDDLDLPPFLYPKSKQ